MTLRSKIIFASVLITSVFGVSVMAQVTIDPSMMKTVPKLSPGTVAALNPPCTNIDLGITSVRIDKLRDSLYTATYEIRNFGQQAWKSGEGQAGSVLTMASTRRPDPTTVDTLIPTNTAPGAIVHTVTGRPFYYDRDSRRSRTPTKNSLEIVITFDPDITNDGNTCNDDRQVQNNVFYIGAKLDDFLFRSPDGSKTFTFQDRETGPPLSERVRRRAQH